MKIRFGALAVDAYGKAGGQCIQRRGSLRVLRNITIPTQRIASTQNPQRFINSRFYTAWAFLSSANRAGWDVVGSNITSRNGWGEDRFLTGREAYVRINSIMFPYMASDTSWDSVSYITPIAVFGVIEIDSSNEEVIIPLIADDNVYFYQVKALKLRSQANNPNVSKLKTFSRIDDITDGNTLFQQLLELYNAISPGMVFSISVRAVALGGFTSPWYQAQVVVV